ncbi:MAG: FliH/SctL family protein, partial [Candidatus Puniceispirillum sp.]
EIMRLAKAARDGEFSKSTGIFERPKEAFQTTSMKQLAAMAKPLAAARVTAAPDNEPGDDAVGASVPADNNDEGAPAAALTPESDGAVTSPVETTTDSLQNNPQNNIVVHDGDEQDEAAAGAATDIPKDHAGVSEQSTHDDKSEPVSAAAETNDSTPGGDVAKTEETGPEPATKVDPGNLDAEYQRGFEAGLKAAADQQDQQLLAAINSFTAASEALTQPDNIDLSQLSTAMYGAIAKLASERAGIAIDAHPDAFAARIERMIARIRDNLETPLIRLHPDDATAITSTLETKMAPRQIQIISDGTLNRGDAQINVGDIGVIDLIEAVDTAPGTDGREA